jgi:hypothetical protein
MTMHQNMNVLGIFFNIYPKRAFLEEKKSSLIILLSSLELQLSSRLVRCVEDVACKSSHNNSHNQKK